MKIITEPSVYLLGRQSVDQPELDRFLADHGVAWETDSEVAAEVLTETAGRVCYLSFAKPRPGGNAAYLGHIKEVGHGSVLEHAVWNLLITGVSRSLTHELVRHRVGLSPSQLSQRYVDESVAEYVVPHDLQEEVAAAQFFETIAAEYDRLGQSTARQNPDGRCDFDLMHDRILKGTAYGHMRWDEFFALVNPGRDWLEAVSYVQTKYRSLSDYLTKKATARTLAEYGMTPEMWKEHSTPELRTAVRKGARQAARSVLPNATETKIFVTANARALRHFIEQRGSRHADPEIRKLAGAVHLILAKEAPNLFGDYVRTALPDGTAELTTPHPKV